MIDVLPGKRIKEFRKALHLSQDAFAARIRRDRSTIAKIESGAQELTPAMRQAICGEFSVQEEWIIHGTGDMFRRGAQGPCSACEPSYASLPLHPAAALMPASAASSPDVDPCIQAMADVKEIFDSGDPILIPAIQANLHAFKRALQRERQFEQILHENVDIKNRMTKLEQLSFELKNQFETLKAENLTLRTENNRLKATYEANQDGDKGSLATTEKKAT